MLSRNVMGMGDYGGEQGGLLTGTHTHTQTKNSNR